MGAESDLVRSILGALALVSGVHALRLNAGTIVLPGPPRRVVRGVEPGVPDIVVMLRGGRVVWVEVKAPNGRLSPSQNHWHAMARRHGHTIIVGRDVPSVVSAVRVAMAARATPSSC